MSSTHHRSHLPAECTPLTYIRKSKGPNIDPWGTQVIIIGVEIILNMTKAELRF